MPNQRQLIGEVQSGRRIAAEQLRPHALEIEKLVGQEIVEGSLNILLKWPIMLSTNDAMRFGEERYLWPAEMNGFCVWVYRWRGAPLHVAEVISPVHFRRTLGLRDGDLIALTIRKADVGEISAVGKSVWALFWLGRRRWVYTQNAYYYWAKRWCRRFGATQAGTPVDQSLP